MNLILLLIRTILSLAGIQIKKAFLGRYINTEKLLILNSQISIFRSAFKEWALTKPLILFEGFLQLLLNFLQPLPNAPYCPAPLDDHRFPRLNDGQPKAFGKPDREVMDQASPEVKFRVLQAPLNDKIKNDLVVIRLQSFHDH